MDYDRKSPCETERSGEVPLSWAQKSIMVGWTLRINWPTKDFELPFYDGPKAIGKGIFLFASSSRNKTNLLAKGGRGGQLCGFIPLATWCMLAFLYPFKSCKCKTSEPRTYENLMPPPVLTEYFAPTPVLTCLVLPDQSPRKNV